MAGYKIDTTGGGTGVFTIATPNSNTDRTITLPDEAGTVLTSASNTNFPAGSVLQVVNATYSTTVSTTSSTLTSTGLTATITPTSASSKVLVSVCLNGVTKNSGSGTTNMNTDVQRDSTSIIAFESQALLTSVATELGIGTIGTTYLDSPNTTSATTYTVRFACEGGAVSIFCQRDSATSTITLMEIAG